MQFGRSVASILALVRWENALLSVAGVVLGAWWATGRPNEPETVVMAGVAILLTAFANADNDVRDYESDRVAHPERPLPAGRLSIETARIVVGITAAAALVLALAYVTFEIRRLYHGPVISSGPTTGAEQYTYSIAYLAFGVVLLGIGILFNSQRARLASAVVIGLTILKAFLVDMSALTGVYRALSFMCLGIVMVAIGWLYQRILFRRQVAPPPAPQGST